MTAFEGIFDPHLSTANLTKSTYGGVDIYEYMGAPIPQSTRRSLIETISNDFSINSSVVGEFTASIANSIRLRDGSNQRVIQSGASVLVVSNTARQTVAVLKLNPRGTRRPNLTPKGLGITRSGTPSTPRSYITFDEIISTINNTLNQYLNAGSITLPFAEWVRLNLQYFDPRNSSNTSQQIRNNWNSDIESEITSELLEIFCGFSYIKAITSSSASLRASQAERTRVYQLLGTTSPDPNAFRVWFPESSNYPIIDCQVGYFENGSLKAAFPISTKNITGGREPNVIKFGDIFENSRQPLQWKNSLPRKISNKQGVQAVVASQAVGRSSGGRASAYPIYAAKSIFESKLTRQIDKQNLVNNLKQVGVRNINTNQVRNLLRDIGNRNHRYEDPIDNILGNQTLPLGKRMILALIRRPRSKYVRDIAQYTDEFLLNCTQATWNDVIRSRFRSLDYPYTFQNLSLYFELALERNSVRMNGPTDYKKMVDSNYFTGNRALASRYSGVPPLGALNVILAKVNVGSNGMIRIIYDTSVKSKNQYGLRSKNSLNNLQDTLGIAP